jgi:hypothetical protein
MASTRKVKPIPKGATHWLNPNEPMPAQIAKPATVLEQAYKVVAAGIRPDIETSVPVVGDNKDVVLAAVIIAQALDRLSRAITDAAGMNIRASRREYPGLSS